MNKPPSAELDRDPATLAPIERLLHESGIPPSEWAEIYDEFVAGSSIDEIENVYPYQWEGMWARPAQVMPEGEWDTWMIRAGRGFGKTRAGAEAVRKRVAAGLARAVTIIGRTPTDARDVMIEGPESGLIAVHPNDFRPTYEPSKRLITWPNGAIGHVRSSEEPDSVRGLQSDLVWGDEPASWKTGSAAWDNAALGNRLGKHPRAILTGTPRPLPWLRDLEKQAGTIVTTGSTYDNIDNLAPAFIRLILDRYEGTRLGAQELHALYLEDVEGALWKMATIEATRIQRWDPREPWRSLAAELDRARMELGLPLVPLQLARRRWRVIVAVDPPGETAECGIVVAAAPADGRQGYDHCLILDDASMPGPVAPEVWGPRVVATYKYWNAEAVYVEKNQGGDMTRSTIHAADPATRVEKISSADSKTDRAEPIATLYAKGWVHHVGHFPKLEDQMTTWVPTETKGKSPDRIDALVHCVRELLHDRQIVTSKVRSPLQKRI